MVRSSAKVEGGRRARTRIAPSPTGALHLGNLRTFLVNWAIARRHGQEILLRVEDLDGPRVRPEAEREAIDLLAWIGLDWDAGPVRQSSDLEPYAMAMTRLAAARDAYPCDMSRREIEAAASAPHGDGGELRFPPDLRPDPVPAAVFDDAAAQRGWRAVVPPGPRRFDDALAGAVAIDPSASVGDFVVWTKRGQPSYQLAVVVDDARQGVTHVVRGDDLLDSTARQLHLYEALGLEPPAWWCHLPLVVGADGRRLAKRHGDTRTARYRAAGVAPERIVGLLAAWSGVAPRAPMSAAAFRDAFELDRMPRDPVVFTPEDEAWLLD